MSVLQDMTKGIMDTKATKAAKLTPVVGEAMTSVEQAAMLVAGANAPFPFDQLAQSMLQVAAQLRREAATIITAAEHIEQAANIGPGHPNFKVLEGFTPEVTDAIIEAVQPPEELGERMARLTERAKAEVFAAADDGADEEPAAPTTGWVCPTHGDKAIIQLKTRAGLAYKVCDKCDSVEPRKESK